MTKLLALLVLLVSCQLKDVDDNIKIGICFRLYTDYEVSDFVVRDVFRNKIVASVAFLNDNKELIYAPSKHIFSRNQLLGNYKIIDCQNVE